MKKPKTGIPPEPPAPTLSEWMEAVDKYRVEVDSRTRVFTPHQEKLLLHAATPNAQGRIRWEDIARWWKEQFGWGGITTLKKKYRELKEKQKLLAEQ